MVSSAKITLRVLLEGKQQNDAFTGALADLEVDHSSVHWRIADMNRALVAHDALCMLLAKVDVPMPINKLIDAIAKAKELDLITRTEEKWLRYFNWSANQAKHNGLPF